MGVSGRTPSPPPPAGVERASEGRVGSPPDGPSGAEEQAVPDRTALDQELAALDAERLAIDRHIRDAVARQRHGTDPRAIEQARADEARWLQRMDRLMTRIRATESRLLLQRRGSDRWR